MATFIEKIAGGAPVESVGTFSGGRWISKERERPVMDIVRADVAGGGNRS